MNHEPRIGCVLMAAGNGARFGANKLLVPYRGKSLILRALEAVPAEALCAVVVVTQYPEIEELAKDFGFSCVRNDAPELGISRTVRLGTEKLQELCDGILYQVADQPLLRRETVLRLTEVFRENPDRIVVPVSGTRRGNPCLFPSDLFPQLRSLQGDRGGSQVIKQFPERVLAVEVPAEELFDVDTAQALSDLS